MKIKNGFTLIELLAVIVILAIIALIATPLVIGIIDDSKVSSFKESANGIVRAVDLYMSSNNIETATIFYKDNEFFTIKNTYSNKEVIFIELKGEKPDLLKMTIDNDGNKEFKMTKKNLCAYIDNTTKRMKSFDGKKDKKRWEENCHIEINEKPPIEKVKVTFISNNNHLDEIVKQVEINNFIDDIPIFTNEEHKFLGWYKDKELTEIWVFDEDKVEISDIMLYGAWTSNKKFTVTFNVNFGTPPPEKQLVSYDSLVSQVKPPTKKGWRFYGWFIEEKLNTDERWDFLVETIKEDTILHAKWIAA